MIVESQGTLWSRDIVLCMCELCLCLVKVDRGGGKTIGDLRLVKDGSDTFNRVERVKRRTQTPATFVHRLELLMLLWAGGCLGL